MGLGVRRNGHLCSGSEAGSYSRLIVFFFFFFFTLVTGP